MQPRAGLLTLLLLSACSGSDSTPTELRPSLATGGTGCTVSLTAGKATPINPPTNSPATVKFTAKNVSCSSSSWSLPTASRTGTVAAITGISPTNFVLALGATKTVTVSFTTGPTAGAGTVTLSGDVDGPGATLSETANVTVGGATGIPFGPTALLSSGIQLAPFTFTAENVSANSANSNYIIDRIGFARDHGIHLVLVMTGGVHTAANRGCCLTLPPAPPEFDRHRWDSTLATFATRAIKDSINAGVADGTIIGANVMDEPYIHQTGGNTWGDSGTMTKARVDALCKAVQDTFPGLRAGVGHQHQLFEPDKNYQVCQFIIDQYRRNYGLVGPWRDQGEVIARREHRQTIYELNVLDGGCQTGSCPMTAQNIIDWGSALVGFSCGLALWQSNTNYFAPSATDKWAAFQNLANQAAAQPFKECKRN